MYIILELPPPSSNHAPKGFQKKNLISSAPECLICEVSFETCPWLPRVDPPCFTGLGRYLEANSYGAEHEHGS